MAVFFLVNRFNGAEIYANHYLGGFGQYISVSARFEKVSLHYSRLSLV